MSEFLKVTKLSDRAGTGAVNFSNGFNINGSDSGISSFTHTEGATEPSSPSNGDTWWDSDNDIYKVYMNNEWKDWLGGSAGGTGVWYGDRGLYFGGSTGSNNPDNQIEKVDITSAGNATDFGDLTTKRKGVMQGASDGSIGLMIAGDQDNYLSDGVYRVNNIDKVTTSTAANATDFGDTTGTMRYGGAHSNGSRCVYGGGSYNSDAKSNVLEYVTIATPGNGTDFGDLSETVEQSGFVGNATRGVRGGGQISSGSSNVLEYWTIDTPVTLKILEI